MYVIQGGPTWTAYIDCGKTINRKKFENLTKIFSG